MIAQLFMLVAVVIPGLLVIWYAVSAIGRLVRGIEDIAQTLRRMEKNGPRFPA